MKLPTIDTYAFPVTLPSSGRSIRLRPFLVREEKLLLMAQESNTPQERVDAVAQVIRNCSNEDVEPTTAPFFDIEYLLLQLRSRSVGESISFTYECNNELSENVKCRHRTPVKINLNDIRVEGNTSNTPPYSIPLSEKYILNLRYPTVYTIEALLASALSTDTADKSDTINKIVDIFDTLVDLETNTTFRFDEYNAADKIDFLDTLMPADYEKIIEFVSSMPTLKYTISYTCTGCNFAHQITLSGLSDFLA